MAAGEMTGGGGGWCGRHKKEQRDIPGEWMGNWSERDVGCKHTVQTGARGGGGNNTEGEGRDGGLREKGGTGRGMVKKGGR